MAKTIIDELVTLLSFQSDKKSERSVSRFRDGLASLRRAGIAVGVALTAASAGIGLLVTKTNSSIDAQGKFAKSLGISFENLQALQFAGKIAGATTEDINSSLEKLTQTMSSPIPGEYNRELKLLGINIKSSSGALRPATAVLIDISKAMQNLSNIQQIQIGEKLGLSAGTIKLLQTGPVAIENAMKKARRIGGVIPESATKVAANYDTQLNTLKTTIKGLSATIVLGLTPSIIKAVVAIENLILKNKDLITTKIKDFIIGVGKGFSAFFSIIRVVAGFISTVVGKFSKLKGGMGEIKGVADVVEGALIALTVAFVAANIEIIAVIAAITALIALEPQLKSFFSAFSRAGKQVPAQVKKAFGLDKPREREILGLDTPRSKAVLGNFGKLFKAPTTTRIPLSSSVSKSVANTNTTNQGDRNNVTINVNGAKDPRSVGTEVVSKLLGLSGAFQVASPGFNRPPVA